MAALMSSSVRAPRWRTPARVPWSFSARESNTPSHATAAASAPRPRIDVEVVDVPGASGPGDGEPEDDRLEGVRRQRARGQPEGLDGRPVGARLLAQPRLGAPLVPRLRPQHVDAELRRAGARAPREEAEGRIGAVDAHRRGDRGGAR